MKIKERKREEGIAWRERETILKKGDEFTFPRENERNKEGGGRDEDKIKRKINEETKQ